MAEFEVPVVLVSVEKMKIFLYQNTNCPSEVHDVVERAKNCLEILQAYLRDLEDQTDGSNLENLRQNCMCIAQDIEDVLDEFMLELVYHLFHSTKLSWKLRIGGAYFSLAQKARLKLSSHIEKTVSLSEDKKISGGAYFILVPKARLKLSSHIEKIVSLLGDKKISGGGLRSRREDQLTKKTPKEDEVEGLEELKQKLEDVVGFEELKEKLEEQLMEEDSRLSTIAVVGMGGCGKTTLAKMIYESIRVRDNFDCQAWVDASTRPLRLNEVHIDMLGESELNSGKESAETDKKAKLRLLPQKKRYLIVLDDVRSKQDWSYIQDALRKGGFQGSRIILTTRNSDVASFSAQYIHDLTSGLSDDDAWKLFCRKAFQNTEGKSPDVLEKWPNKFLKSCEGMPLAISTLGTFLGKRPQKPDEWNKLHDNLGFELCRDSELSVLSRNLQPSYSDLPSHLKSCFLYFSIFPEDYSISRERLIRLWVAEGFVMPERGITVEQVAEDYLNELIARNLVVVTDREVDGGRVRSCRVLHLVRQIIISRQQSFVTVLEQNCNLFATLGKKIRRLSVNKGPINWVENRTSCIRSLLVFGIASSSSELEMVFKTSKFLRVLDLNDVDLKKFPISIVELILLRYLSLRGTTIKIVPKSIGNLQFLETFDLKHTLVRKLPEAICKLVRLRHLLVSGKNEWSGGVDLSARNIGAISSIQKLSFIKVGNNRIILKALGELIGLRNLGLTDLKKENGEELCGSIQKMENLSTLDVRSTSKDECLDLDHMNYPLETPLYLQHLYLKGRLERVPQWIPELTSLTKIGLKWSKLKAQANPLEAIQALPNLIEMDLGNYYSGNVLIFKAETFLKLVKLTINHFEKLTSMVVEDGAMPLLKNLNMWRCQNLKSLPAGIGGLIFLKEFLLYEMADEFIAKLQKDSEDRQGLQHIEVIRHYYEGNDDGSFTKVMDLSPSQWHLE